MSIFSATASIIKSQSFNFSRSLSYVQGVINDEFLLENNGEGWLIVDDLVDTGETIKAIRSSLPNAHYATVYAKPSGREQVDTFITEVSQDTWIYFPWDMEMKPAPTISERTQK